MNDPLPRHGTTIARRLLLGYVISVSVAHEFGFWRNFHVQILEHIGLADLPKLALWPVIATAGTVFFGILVAEIALPPPAADGIEVQESRLRRRWRLPVGSLLYIFGFLSFSFLPHNELWFAYGPLCIAAGLTIVVNTETMWARLGLVLPERFTFVAILLLCLAFGVGQNQAVSIINGTDYLAASFRGATPAPVRYVGRAGDYVFFWNPRSNETQIRRLESIQPLLLRRESDLESVPESPSAPAAAAPAGK